MGAECAAGETGQKNKQEMEGAHPSKVATAKRHAFFTIYYIFYVSYPEITPITKIYL